MIDEQEEKFLFDTAIEQRTELGLKGTLDSFMAGAQWQASRSYSEEEVLKLLSNLKSDAIRDFGDRVSNINLLMWFQRFKK